MSKRRRTPDSLAGQVVDVHAEKGVRELPHIDEGDVRIDATHGAVADVGRFADLSPNSDQQDKTEEKQQDRQKQRERQTERQKEGRKEGSNIASGREDTAVHAAPCDTRQLSQADTNIKNLFDGDVK